MEIMFLLLENGPWKNERRKKKENLLTEIISEINFQELRN